VAASAEHEHRPGGPLVGVDLGGTKVTAAAFTGGELGEPSTAPTDTDNDDELIDQIVGLVDEVRTPDTVAVGLGVPSVIDFATGRVKASVNVPLRDVPIRELLGERLGLPVFVDNDANCAALAEAHEGERLVVRDLVMFTVGTGVGGGLVLNGRPYRGATGAAAELGHGVIALDLTDGAPATRERFPQAGTLEDVAAGRALDGLARTAARDAPDSALGRLAASGRELTGRDAVEAAREGDEAARRAVRLLGERLGIGIANAINTFDPEVVAIGGGVSAAGDLLLEPARETALRYVLPGVGERTEIRLARYGPQAGLRGAALLAGQELAAHEGGHA